MGCNYFVPILEDQPLQYAFDRPQYYRNAAREQRWGCPVYFVPACNGYDVTGQAGPGYQYGKPYKVTQGKYGNCTWWVMGRNYEVNGDTLVECIGDASGFYAKYKGNKDGGSITSGKYFGDTIKAGDILVFADSKSSIGVGHVAFVEKVDCNTLYISESGYSTNVVYKGKACITYTLDKSVFKCGNPVKLRPQSPYTEYAYGVIHTGKEVEAWEAPTAVCRDTKKNQLYIGEVKVNIRAAANISSESMGVYNHPNAYFDVDKVVEGCDFTWYRLGHDAYIAGCDPNNIIYYPKGCDQVVNKPNTETNDRLCALENALKQIGEIVNKTL